MNRVGLCARCANARTVRSRRGSMFILCQLHRTDPRFEQYPVLPVLECPGYEPDADDPAVVEEGRP
jgi:hypothetical protein